MPQYELHHIHLISADPMKAAEFYERVFGAKRVSSGKFPDGGTRIDLNLGGSRLMLRSPRNAAQSSQDAPRQRLGLEHFGLGVENIEVAIADLKAKGVKFLDEHSSSPGGSKIAFVIAPDNVIVELLQTS